MWDILIGEITQSVLALAIVIGGGVMVALYPETRELAGSIIGLVVGYYFNRANGIYKEIRRNGVDAATTGSGASLSEFDR